MESYNFIRRLSKFVYVQFVVGLILAFSTHCPLEASSLIMPDGKNLSGPGISLHALTNNQTVISRSKSLTSRNPVSRDLFYRRGCSICSRCGWCRLDGSCCWTKISRTSGLVKSCIRVSTDNYIYIHLIIEIKWSKIINFIDVSQSEIIASNYFQSQLLLNKWYPCRYRQFQLYSCQIVNSNIFWSAELLVWTGVKYIDIKKLLKMLTKNIQSNVIFPWALPYVLL